VVELRRTPRAPIDAWVEFTTKGSTEPRRGRARDISLGGMFIETETPPAFGAEVTVRVELTNANGKLEAFALPGTVRWTRTKGMGVQFKLLGARETHAITEVVRVSDEAEIIHIDDE